MMEGLFELGPLAFRLGGGSRSVCATVGDMLGSAQAEGARAADVDLDISVDHPRPRQWSREKPGWYKVDSGRAAIHMEVADWTADFLLAERRTTVTFRELWYPGVEHFFKIFVQTWLPVCGAGIAFHASAVRWQGRCLLFPARAETGKTTVARALHERGGTVITEEMACCSADDDGAVLYSLPFRERSGLNSGDRLVVALDRVYSLRQSERTRVVPADAAWGALLLARNAAVGFRETQVMTPAMDACIRLARLVPVAVLEFTRGLEFVDVIQSDWSGVPSDCRVGSDSLDHQSERSLR